MKSILNISESEKAAMGKLLLKRTLSGGLNPNLKVAANIRAKILNPSNYS